MTFYDFLLIIKYLFPLIISKPAYILIKCYKFKIFSIVILLWDYCFSGISAPKRSVHL